MSGIAAGMLASTCLLSAAAALLARDRRAVASRVGAPGPRPRRVPLSAGVAPWTGPGSCLLGAAIGGAFAGVPGVIVGAGGGLALTVALRRRRTARALARVEEQLADAVSAIAAGLRAGLSLSQALAYSSRETSDPLGSELRSIAERAAMGEPLDATLARWSRERGGADARLMVGVLGMHRRSGGDLPTVLDRLATTLRGRRAAQRELRALTAQARLSGAILGLLPIGFFGFLGLTAPRDLSAALHAPSGRVAIVAGFVLQGSAFVWIRRLLRVV